MLAICSSLWMVRGELLKIGLCRCNYIYCLGSNTSLNPDENAVPSLYNTADFKPHGSLAFRALVTTCAVTAPIKSSPLETSSTPAAIVAKDVGSHDIRLSSLSVSRPTEA